MTRITAGERNFWLDYFRGKISAVTQDYKQKNQKFLNIELRKQAKVKANETLGITTLIETYDKLNEEIDVKKDALAAAQSKLRVKHQADIEPLETQRDKVYAKRIAKVMDGNVSRWAKYGAPHRQPYEFESKIRDAINTAYTELYKASDVGKHIDKLVQQFDDAPVALMLATSRREMSNAVQQLAAVIGIDLPDITGLEDLT